jgi:hypothetical protein
MRAAAERAAVQGALAPVHTDQWWNQAQSHDIARVHALAEGWKDHDPTALAASERIRTEVRRRYGIDTHDVGKDAEYLVSGIETISAEQARRAAGAEHRKGMALIAAAQADEHRAKAHSLAPEMERHQVPIEYLNNSALVEAPQGQGGKASASSAPQYGSADYHQAFAASLARTASASQIQGRLTAARSEGTHPSSAVSAGKSAAKARKIRTGATVSTKRTRNTPSR